jgi:hypothetical protein
MLAPAIAWSWGPSMGQLAPFQMALALVSKIRVYGSAVERMERRLVSESGKFQMKITTYKLKEFGSNSVRSTSTQVTSNGLETNRALHQYRTPARITSWLLENSSVIADKSSAAPRGTSREPRCRTLCPLEYVRFHSRCQVELLGETNNWPPLGSWIQGMNRSVNWSWSGWLQVGIVEYRVTSSDARKSTLKLQQSEWYDVREHSWLKNGSAEPSIPGIRWEGEKATLVQSQLWMDVMVKV